MYPRYLLATVLAFGAIPANVQFAEPHESNALPSPKNAEPAAQSSWQSFATAINGLTNFDALGSSAADDETADNVTSETATENKPVVWLRISRDYLANHLEREVDREKPARDEILGITFIGKSRTVGQSKLILHPSEQGASGEVTFAGTIESHTTGRKGPATLHYRADSKFQARKPLTVTATGIETAPAEAIAPTKLTPVDIDSHLPGLRGRLVERIATRRAAKSQAEADAIASEHRAEDICAGLDRRLGDKLAEVETQLRTQIVALGHDDRALQMKSRSTADYVEVALLPLGCDANHVQMPEFEVDADSDLCVRVHRSLVARAMSDAKFRERLSVLAAGVLQTSAVGDSSTIPVASDQLANLLTGSEWLAYDISLPATEESVFHQVVTTTDVEQQ